MKQSLLDLIICPLTRRPLQVEKVDEERNGEILTGLLKTTGPEKPNIYPIEEGVPNLLAPLNEAQSKQTVTVFGEEWEHYSYWGWLDSVPDGLTELDMVGGMLKDAERMYRHKTQFSEEMVHNSSVALDVGCGNGRHSYQALQAGHANVVSMDASNAIHIARRNFLDRGIKHTHFVRGNALNLPFKNDCFDHVFSIGVMQHTGGPQSFLQEQSRVAKPDGSISLNCYGTGTGLYEFSDWFLRLVTTRMSITAQKKFAAQMARLGKWVWQNKESGIRGFVADNLSVQPTEHHMFDWYSPQIADHYSPRYLKQLFAKLSLTPVAANYEIWRQDYDDRPRRQKHYAFCFHLKNQKSSSDQAGANG